MTPTQMAEKLIQHYLSHPIASAQWRGRILQVRLTGLDRDALVNRITDKVRDEIYGDLHRSQLGIPLTYLVRMTLSEVDWAFVAETLVKRLGGDEVKHG